MTETSPRPYADALARLKAAKLRPTRQRLALSRLLFDQGDRHVTAEAVHAEAIAAGARVSLATIYNTLHQFVEVGLLREVVIESGKTYFDTNTTDHHHFYLEQDGTLIDVPGDSISLGRMPPAPNGMAIDRVEVIIRLLPIS